MAKSYFGVEKHDPDDADGAEIGEADAAADSIARHAPMDTLDAPPPEEEVAEPEVAAPEEAPPAPVEETPAPEPVPTPEPEQPVEEPYKLAGSYATPEELEKAHEHLRAAFGRQGQELGELRKTQRDLEAAPPAAPPAPMAAPAAPAPASPPPGQGGPVWSDPRQQQAINHKTQAYVDVGYGTADAKRLAEADVYANTLSSQAVTDTAIAPLTQRDYAIQRNSRLQSDAGALRDETDPEGRPLRADWNEITETPEFEALVHEMGDKIYEIGPDQRPIGLETAYLRTRFSVSHRIQAQADSATAAADETVERDKIAAGAIPASPGPRVAEGNAAVADEDQVILDIYASAKGTTADGEPKPYFLGGGVKGE